MDRFTKLLDAGDVVGAICAAPFGYTSRRTEEGFHFIVHTGPLAGREGKGRELLEAVRNAVAPALEDDKVPGALTDEELAEALRAFVPELVATTSTEGDNRLGALIAEALDRWAPVTEIVTAPRNNMRDKPLSAYPPIAGAGLEPATPAL